MSSSLVLGTRKGWLLYELNAGRWELTRESHSGVHVSYAMSDDRQGKVYSCHSNGHFGVKFHTSDDRGQTWSELPAPAYPEDAVQRSDNFAPADQCESVPATLDYLWCLTPGGADQPGRLYAGTVPGGLFVSDDGGQTFSLCESLWNHPSRYENWFGGGMDRPGIHSVVVDPRDSNHLAVGISCAGVFVSKDGGQSWQPKNQGLVAEFLPNPDSDIGHDPHLLVQCQSQPDVLWQQNHCGIFRSTDGGENWSQVSTKGEAAHFGFAVEVDPQDGDTAWVIPAESDEVRAAVDRRLQVCRTSNGGQTWDSFTAGLPQENCFDFVFRHGLDLAGDRLAFGTACGSLYVSEDRGESWQAIASHLPPIYSCRFA